MTKFISKLALAVIALFLLFNIFSCRGNEPIMYVSVISGEWWSVANNPDPGPLTGDRQQTVDFAVWQAADGNWQLWSCIRGTRCVGRNRLFYGWEGSSLTGANWKPLGIVMTADTPLGETEGGLQAPYVFRWKGKYRIIYGGFSKICLAESIHGKNFTRALNEEGSSELFSGSYLNTRDPMVIRLNRKFYGYYTGYTCPDGTLEENGQVVKKTFVSGVFCRTSDDLLYRSNAVMVSAGVEAGDRPGSSVCPFVVEKEDWCYLFRNQYYGENNLNIHYASKNPFDFGVGYDEYNIGTLPVAMPEIVACKGRDYIFILNPGPDEKRMTSMH